MQFRDVFIREVGLRDGLQSMPAIMPTAEKLAWCRGSAAAGIAEIEVASFVPRKLLPQMADAREVVQASLMISDLTVAVLVPNLRGAKDAIDAGAHRINCVVAVSEGHNRSNLRRSTEEAIEEFAAITAFCKDLLPERRPIVVAGLATCFGCTIDGHVDEGAVRRTAARLQEIGADELLIADTVGYGNPAAVKRVFSGLRSDLGKDIPIGAHFHDTRGTGLANVIAALEVGITNFDSALGGLGGCPYAPGATGNIATEDLVYMLEAMGVRTGISLAALLDLRKAVEAKLPQAVFHGSVAKAGIPKNFPNRN